MSSREPLLGERWHRVAMTERGFAKPNAIRKRGNSRPLSVALTGASSPQWEPFSCCLRSHIAF